MKVSLGMFTVYDAMQKDLADTIGRLRVWVTTELRCSAKFRVRPKNCAPYLSRTTSSSAAGMWNGAICSPKQLQKRFAIIKR